MENQTQKSIALRVSVKSIVVNTALTAFKLLAGYLAGSVAMISDAVHSASDVFSTVVVMVGVSISGKKADKEHPYGHERMECVAAILLAVILCATGVGIGYTAVMKIAFGMKEDLQIPGLFALFASIVSIGVKEWMYWFTRSAAKKINSGALMADAWHHRSDALSSVGSLVGIVGARLGFPILDPLACVVICFFILKASYDIFMDAVNKMTDSSCDEETVKQISELVLKQNGVESLDVIKTRLFGARIYVDIEIGANSLLTLSEAHRIAQLTHDAIEERFKTVKHCTVHVNPVNCTELQESIAI